MVIKNNFLKIYPHRPLNKINHLSFIFSNSSISIILLSSILVFNWTNNISYDLSSPHHRLQYSHSFQSVSVQHLPGSLSAYSELLLANHYRNQRLAETKSGDSADNVVEALWVLAPDAHVGLVAADFQQRSLVRWWKREVALTCSLQVASIEQHVLDVAAGTYELLHYCGAANVTAVKHYLVTHAR